MWKRSFANVEFLSHLPESFGYESVPCAISPVRLLSWAPPEDWPWQQLLRAAPSEEQKQELQQQSVCGFTDWKDTWCQ